MDATLSKLVLLRFLIGFLLISQTFATTILSKSKVFAKSSSSSSLPSLILPESEHAEPRFDLDHDRFERERILDSIFNSQMFKVKTESRSGLSSITAFVTDPALLVTILHSLEVAYWTLPFGFILNPVINLFRVPNRRMDHGDHIVDGKQSTKENLLNVIKRTHLPSSNSIRKA